MAGFTLAVEVLMIQFSIHHLCAGHIYDNEEKYKLLDQWRSPGLELERNFTYFLAGHDYAGRPVWIMEVGNWHFSQLAKQETKELNANWDIYAEQMAFRFYNSPQKYAKKLQGSSEENEDFNNTTANEWVLICQMDGFDLQELASPKGLGFAFRLGFKLEIASANIEYGFILNTNYFASTFINLLRPVLGNLLPKMDIYGTQMQMWKPQVLKKIPEKEVSPLFGDDKNYKPIAVFG